MIKKRINIATILTVLMFVLSGNILFSQSVSEILSKSEDAIFQKGKATKIHFSSSTYNYGAETSPVAVDGDIILQGDRFRLNYGGILATFSSPVLSAYDKGQNTLNISEPTKDELMIINPIYILRSNAKDFQVKKDPPTKSGNVLVFTPLKKTFIMSILVIFDRKTNLPTRVVVKDTVNSSRLEVHLNRYEFIPLLSKESFVLDPSNYQGAEVVDLR